MPNAIIENGTPEELVKRLAEKAPSLGGGRYRLVMRPERDARLIADQLDALFNEMDKHQDPMIVGMTENEVMEYADRAIAEGRAIRRATNSV